MTFTPKFEPDKGYLSKGEHVHGLERAHPIGLNLLSPTPRPIFSSFCDPAQTQPLASFPFSNSIST
jgi:hypothetical protein